MLAKLYGARRGKGDLDEQLVLQRMGDLVASKHYIFVLQQLPAGQQVFYRSAAARCAAQEVQSPIQKGLFRKYELMSTDNMFANYFEHA